MLILGMFLDTLSSSSDVLYLIHSMEFWIDLLQFWFPVSVFICYLFVEFFHTLHQCPCFIQMFVFLLIWEFIFFFDFFIMLLTILLSSVWATSASFTLEAIIVGLGIWRWVMLLFFMTFHYFFGDCTSGVISLLELC